MRTYAGETLTVGQGERDGHAHVRDAHLRNHAPSLELDPAVHDARRVDRDID